MGPGLLIASPQMRDPSFERTVVLLWHYDEDGAIGVVVNRPMDVRLSQVVTTSDDGADQRCRVGWGGPVEPETGTVVSQAAVDDDQGWNLPTGIGISRSQTVLEAWVSSNMPMELLLGYAGWGPGQLDDEIRTGGWLIADVDAALLFATPVDERYDRALATLGLSASTVWMTPIDE